MATKAKTKAEKKPKAKTRPESKAEITLQALLEAGCHFGHQSRRWNPKMKPYLYAIRDGVHIFDLAKTKDCLEKAAEFAKTMVAEGKTVLFVGTKRQAQSIIKEEAQKIGIPFVSERWLGGTITNWSEIKKRIEMLAEMVEKKEKGEYKKYTKKEQLEKDQEISRLKKFFGGLSSLKGLPDLIFIVDAKKEESAVREAKKKDIPIIAVVDSNTDPGLVDWVIPANDDAVGSIKFIVSVMAKAVADGQGAAAKKSKKK